MKLTAKHSQVGYVGPESRVSCRHCKHVRDLEDRPGFQARLRCVHHEVEVRGAGVCPDYAGQYGNSPQVGARA